MKPDIKQRIEQFRRGEVPEGYKKTKAGMIPEEWEEKYVYEICKTLGGGTPDTNNYLYWSGKIPWVSSSDVYEDNITKLNITRYITDDAIQNSATKLIPPNSILVVSRVGVGKVVISPIALCTSQDFTNLTNIQGNIYYIATSLRRSLSKKMKTLQGTSIKGMPSDEIKKQILLFPPLPEQHKIAEILTAQDRVIELKEQLLAQKQQQKKYLMQQLLTGKKRLPGFSGEWDIKPLKKIVEKQKSKNNDFKYQLVLSNSAQHGIISQEQEFDKEIANEERIDGYYIVIPEAFVYNPRISVTAPCGPINMNETGETGIISPLYTVFTVSSSEISQNFLKYYFKSSCWHKYVKGVANYGARHDRISISDGDFFEMPIFLPIDKEEQTAIADVLSAADREIDLLRQNIESEKQKKKALMQLLLTGIVRVTGD